MKRPKRIARCVAACLAVWCMAADSHAFDTPPQMEPKRRQLFEMMQFTPAFREHGIAHAQALQVAKEIFRRFGMLNRCPVAFTSVDGMLSPKYRQAVEQTAAKTRTLVTGANQENFAYLAGAPMWAFDQLSEQEVDGFLAIRAAEGATEAFASLARATFLQQFHLISSDIEAGMAEPASVIWLKDYFRREGALDRLEALVDELVPAASVNFRRAGNFSDHTPADAQWLRALALQIRYAAPQLAERLFAQETPGTRLMVATIQAQRPFVLLASAEEHEAAGMKFQLRVMAALQLVRPDPSSPLDSAIERQAPAGVAGAYPEAPGFLDGVIMPMGPRQMVGDLGYKLCGATPPQ
ncbi:hypothetical protein [Polaromonas sp. YR568]|uniref:hypothetical protein n=1 Tax=Polaromonas sp. YR568 TaxID=1855301 RepID=UPI00398C11C8